MKFSDAYLNATANKTERAGMSLPSFVVWHETASPNPDNPHGTLKYNLAASVRSSYHYLIARDGTVYRYLEPRQYIAWGAGVKSAARGYAGGAVNTHSVNVEVDGDNKGTPITPEQRDSIIALMFYLRDELNIPLERSYHLGHKEVAPGYKSDPRGYSIDVALQMAQETTTKPPLAKPAPVLDLDALAAKVAEVAGVVAVLAEMMGELAARIETARRKP